MKEVLLRNFHKYGGHASDVWGRHWCCMCQVFRSAKRALEFFGISRCQQCRNLCLCCCMWQTEKMSLLCVCPVFYQSMVCCNRNIISVVIAAPQCGQTKPKSGTNYGVVWNRATPFGPWFCSPYFEISGKNDWWSPNSYFAHNRFPIGDHIAFLFLNMVKIRLCWKFSLMC